MSKLVFTIVVFLCFAQSAFSQEKTIVKIKPDSFLSLINKLEKPTLINFWATWCKPCIEELPYFMQLDSASNKDSLDFVFLSFDSPSDSARVQKFIDLKGLKGTHFLLNETDLDQFINQINTNWEGNIPYTIFINDRFRKDHSASFRTFDQLFTFIKTK